jgi:hypothetical protein
VETIEQLSQEALGVREEIRAAEITKAQRRGLLLLKGAQRIIDQLHNDPDLVEMSRILTDDPIERRGEPSGLEPIQLKKITELENLEVPPPQIRSPGGISTQPEIARTPGRISVPNPLFELITIYDDEESSEVSLVTPMQIMEEKEPERASTPGLDASIQNLPQRDHEVESVLDTEILEFLGTPIESYRDELGSGGYKEEIPQQEIDTSTGDYQVSTKPTFGSLVLIDTSPANEK